MESNEAQLDSIYRSGEWEFKQRSNDTLYKMHEGDQAPYWRVYIKGRKYERDSSSFIIIGLDSFQHFESNQEYLPLLKNSGCKSDLPDGYVVKDKKKSFPLVGSSQWDVYGIPDDFEMTKWVIEETGNGRKVQYSGSKSELNLQ